MNQGGAGEEPGWEGAAYQRFTGAAGSVPAAAAGSSEAELTAAVAGCSLADLSGLTTIKSEAIKKALKH